MNSSNKKIKNATQDTLDGIEFKSRLEKMIYQTLKAEGFDPKYEPWKFTIWEGYSPTVPFYDRDSKTGLLKRNTSKLLPMTYTPDFCFEYDGWYIIIEAKGIENEVFPIKKKLFRHYLESWKKRVAYFEIYSKKQLIQAIEIIKSMNQITEIRKLLDWLPTKKDILLANKFLDGRKFEELKELIDSDVEKISRKRYNLYLKEVKDGEEKDLFDLPKACKEIEDKYNQLTYLQSIVNEQAAPFIEDLYDPSLTELDDDAYE